MNCFPILFVLIILEVLLTTCLESRFLILFLLFFRRFNFTLSAIVSSGSNFNSSLSYNGGIAGESSSSKLRINISGLFKSFTLFFKFSEIFKMSSAELVCASYSLPNGEN